MLTKNIAKLKLRESIGDPARNHPSKVRIPPLGATHKRGAERCFNFSLLEITRERYTIQKKFSNKKDSTFNFLQITFSYFLSSVHLKAAMEH